MNPVSHADIVRMAELSGLNIEKKNLAELAGEISAIIEFVSQISEVDSAAGSQPSEQVPFENYVRLRVEDADSERTQLGTKVDVSELEG